MEIWNNVFMEFDRQPGGELKPLPAPSIDTGMGLERVTAVLQGKISTYETDAFTPLLDGDRPARGSDPPRHDGAARTCQCGSIADHMRAMTFLIADGVVPSNESRGYVLRKIMRRAMRHGKKLGLREPFLHTLVDTVVDAVRRRLPGAAGRTATSIAQLIPAEEERFDAVLTNGLPRLEQVLDKAAAAGGVVPGEEAFRLYDTHGVPQDFIEDTIESRRLTLDRAGFDRAMEGQREKARAKSTFKAGAAQDAAWDAPDDLKRSLEATGDQDFRGYEQTELNTQVLAVFDDAASLGRRPGRRRTRLRGARRDAVLSRGRRAGLGRRHHSRAARRGARDGRRCASAPGHGCTRCRWPAASLNATRPRDRRGHSRRARRDPSPSHRHAPAARGAAPGARRPRETGRARWWLPIACASTSSISRR